MIDYIDKFCPPECLFKKRYLEMKNETFNIAICCVDDDTDDLYMIENVIKELNLPNEVRTYSDPRKYIDELDGNVHELILDHKMGALNGLDVLRKVREKNPRAFVILLSAYGDPDILHEYINIGIDKIVKKQDDYKHQLKEFIEVGLKIAAERIYYMNLFIQAGAKP